MAIVNAGLCCVDASLVSAAISRQHRRFERPHAVEHIAHERRVRAELARGDAADAAHQPLLADKAVRRADDVERARVQHRLRDFEVEKARRSSSRFVRWLMEP